MRIWTEGNRTCLEMIGFHPDGHLGTTETHKQNSKQSLNGRSTFALCDLFTLTVASTWVLTNPGRNCGNMLQLGDRVPTILLHTNVEAYQICQKLCFDLDDKQ